MAERASTAAVEIEFFGLPRQRAGVDRCAVAAGTLGQILETLARQLPGLVPDILEARGRPSRHLLIALDGQTIVDDLARPIARGQTLVFISAQAGG